MAVRLTCVDNATGHDGLRWRMGEDAQSVTTVVGETAPGVEELVVNSPIEPEACFSVAAYSGAEESGAASVCADTIEREDLTGAAIGDAVGGGIYAGINTESDGTEYHIIFAMQEGELEAGAESRWKTSQTLTAGTQSETDGWANTLAMEAASLADHPAALYCQNYTGGGKTDWHLPAIKELALEVNIRGHAEMSTDASDRRWASTEISADFAFSRRFSDGREYTNTKNDTYLRVRPVRRVAV